MYRLAVLLNRAEHIFQTEGLAPLLRRGIAFLVGCFFQYGIYYLYEFAMNEFAVREWNEAEFAHRIQNFNLKVVSTNQQADELAAEGLDFRSYVINARRRLDRGAIAFCLFFDGDLAYIGWLAMTEEAKESLTEFPCQVDFSNNEAYTGGIETNPKYRGMGAMGLMGHGYFKMGQFLKERGIVIARGVATRNGIAPRRAYARIGPKLYAEARYLKILWWKSWKEKPLTQGSPNDQCAR